MKILESQSAVLSNYEVYQHVVDLKKRNKKTRHRGPGNYETVLREVRRGTMSQVVSLGRTEN